MKLFDNVPRKDTDPALYSEGEFTYLNRSARPKANKIRQLLETWFSHYPGQERFELKQRIKADHSSAFYELFLHELLFKLKCDVIIHPHKGEADGKRPDFLVKPLDGNCFYLEAVLAKDKTDKEKAAENRINFVYDCLNTLDSPNFFIGVDHIRGSPKTQPSVKKIRSFLSDRLSSLDLNKINELYRSGNIRNIPQWYYEHDGWEIGFYPIPKSPEQRGKTGNRSIGIRSWGFKSHQNLGGFIKKSIKNKTGKYGDFDKPYVIAVNIFGKFSDDLEIANALFGEAVYMGFGSPQKFRLVRIPNGIWTSKSGPINTRVSAILFTKNLTPWNIAKAKACLYHNPWAKKPYFSVLKCLPEMILQNDMLKLIDGESLGNIFDFPPDWPID